MLPPEGHASSIVTPEGKKQAMLLLLPPLVFESWILFARPPRPRPLPARVDRARTIVHSGRDAPGGGVCARAGVAAPVHRVATPLASQPRARRAFVGLLFSRSR